MRETALIIEAADAEGIVSGWWAHHDPVAARGVPCHITALFPFVRPEDFDVATVHALSKVANEIQAFIACRLISRPRGMVVQITAGERAIAGSNDQAPCSPVTLSTTARFSMRSTPPTLTPASQR